MTTTRIIMTECKAWFGGRYVDFKVKDTGEHVAEVDRRDNKYVVFSVRGGLMDIIGSAWTKSAAINIAQKDILELIPDAEFKWNVVSVKER